MVSLLDPSSMLSFPYQSSVIKLYCKNGESTTQVYYMYLYAENKSYVHPILFVQTKYFSKHYFFYYEFFKVARIYGAAYIYI